MTFDPNSTVLVTGGAGFIGTNVADRALRDGARVVVLDDLSRKGVADNLRRLESMHPHGRLRVEIGDIRDSTVVARATKGADTVFHLAAQVAVTTSVDDPRNDFDVNLVGTITLLEAVRQLESKPALLFTSTNKVYGDLQDITAQRRGDRYEAADPKLARFGIPESRPLSFCSPYGCSKGGADQYVLDYAKTYGVPTVVFRMSCIYGPHQCGNEDQGWIAHFLLRAMHGEHITIFGDGAQVRDALYVDDLVDAMGLAVDNIDRLSGQAFNIGGGPGRTISLIELIRLIRGLEGSEPKVDFDSWRIGDQLCYVSDIRKFSTATGWTPDVSIEDGVARLHRWLTENGLSGRLAEAM